MQEDEIPGGALNLNSTNLPRPWSPRGIFPFKENSHGRAGNRTRDLMISNQRLRPVDHEAGRWQILKFPVCAQLRNWIGRTNILKEVLAGPVETRVDGGKCAFKAHKV